MEESFTLIVSTISMLATVFTAILAFIAAKRYVFEIWILWTLPRPVSSNLMTMSPFSMTKSSLLMTPHSLLHIDKTANVQYIVQ